MLTNLTFIGGCVWQPPLLARYVW